METVAIMEQKQATIGDALVAYSGIAQTVVDTGADLIKSLLGEPMKVAGSMVSDQLYGWQLRQRITIAAKAKQLLDKRKIAPHSIATGFLLPFFEAAGNAEESELQDMWAELLASAVENDDAQHPVFIETLRKMSGVDAKLFRKIVSSLDSGLLFYANGQMEKRAAARLIAISIIQMDGNSFAGNNCRPTVFGLEFALAIMPEHRIELSNRYNFVVAPLGRPPPLQVKTVGKPSDPA